MGFFGKKKDSAPEAAPVPTENAPAQQEGGKRFGFGRSKTPAAAPEQQLVVPPSPWAPEGTQPQGSAATSALTSRRNSLQSVRSSVMMELKYEAMVNHLFQQQCSKFGFQSST